MNILEKTNTFVKKGADQCVNIAGQVKNEAPGFFKNIWEVTKKNKEAAIAATVLTGAVVIAYKMGKSKGRKQQKQAMWTFLKRKKVQELIGFAVVLGTTVMIGIDIGRKLSNKKKEEQ